MNCDDYERVEKIKEKMVLGIPVPLPVEDIYFLLRCIADLDNECMELAMGEDL